MYFLPHVRAFIIAAASITASIICRWMGGFDTLLQTLLVFMAIDFFTGWIAAAVFKCSDKTQTGRLSSQAGLRGFIKKGCSLIMIVVAVHLDMLIGTGGITRDAVVIAFALNELLSILENMGRMGVKMPAPIINALDALSKKHTNAK
jgi:toxin secretion/phage lysis holin